MAHWQVSGAEALALREVAGRGEVATKVGRKVGVTVCEGGTVRATAAPAVDPAFLRQHSTIYRHAWVACFGAILPKYAEIPWVDISLDA